MELSWKEAGGNGQSELKRAWPPDGDLQCFTQSETKGHPPPALQAEIFLVVEFSDPKICQKAQNGLAQKWCQIGSSYLYGRDTATFRFWGL